MCCKTDPVDEKKAEADRQTKIANGVSRRVVEMEARHLFKYDDKHLFHEGKIDEIITESDKSRLIYKMLSKIQVRNMVQTNKQILEGDIKNQECEHFTKAMIKE